MKFTKDNLMCGMIVTGWLIIAHCYNQFLSMSQPIEIYSE